LRVIALDLAFTAAVRVIHRVHGDAANRGTNALPARASRPCRTSGFRDPLPTWPP
jgi:hypothetical protein